jgi:uncharacterized phiE125 gp8 family phage protein
VTDPVLITPAVAEPLGLDELKDHLGVTDLGQDALLARQLARARRQVEWLTGLGLAAETWEQALDAREVTGDRLRLGRAPIISITSVTAMYADGTSGTMSASGYYPTRDSLALASGASWPSGLRTYEALVVRYVAGEVPLTGSSLREAVLKLAAWYYAARGDQGYIGPGEQLQSGSIPADVWDALAPYRALGVA